ncbi:MAG: hypothetical protein J3K34DRAFT_390933 [Monoraphidium minutum]|nr:MAG: hypothetical protein J3K34DRAFT_390933 [Monoraphidium minutum]
MHSRVQPRSNVALDLRRKAARAQRKAAEGRKKQERFALIALDLQHGPSGRERPPPSLAATAAAGVECALAAAPLGRPHLAVRSFGAVPPVQGGEAGPTAAGGADVAGACPAVGGAEWGPPPSGLLPARARARAPAAAAPVLAPVPAPAADPAWCDPAAVSEGDAGWAAVSYVQYRI